MNITPYKCTPEAFNLDIQPSRNYFSNGTNRRKLHKLSLVLTSSAQGLGLKASAKPTTFTLQVEPSELLNEAL